MATYMHLIETLVPSLTVISPLFGSVLTVGGTKNKSNEKILTAAPLASRGSIF